MHFASSEKYKKLARKCHNHEAQPSRGTKRRRDEEKNDKTNSTYETTDAQRKKKELQQRNRPETVCRKTALCVFVCVRACVRARGWVVGGAKTSFTRAKLHLNSDAVKHF